MKPGEKKHPLKALLFLSLKSRVTQTSHLCNYNSIKVVAIRREEQ